MHLSPPRASQASNAAASVRPAQRAARDLRRVSSPGPAALPAPRRTPETTRYAQHADTHPAVAALLGAIDGHRNAVELESVARALGLPAAVLERLAHAGLIEFPE